MKTILFVVPRFHTNLFFAALVLDRAGYRVAVFANRQATIEDHSVVTPIILGDDPAPEAVAAAWKKADPDLVLVRKSGGLYDHIVRLARAERRNILLYNQRPLHERQSFPVRLRKRLRGEPVRRVTPVPGMRGGAPDPHAVFLPWPVLRLPAEPVAPGGPGVPVLCVGKLCQPRKNQDKLIDAIRRAGLEEKVHLTLVGGTSHDVSGFDRMHYERLVEAARLPWITMRQDVPFREMPSLYAAHEICVLPSVGEPLGTSPIEAMAYGCVPVISDQAGSAGYLRPGETGMVVGMDRPDDLARQLERLVRDAPLRQRMRAAAEAAARTDYGPERFLDRIGRLLATARCGASVAP